MKKLSKRFLALTLVISCVFLAGCDGISLGKKDAEEEEEDKRVKVKTETPVFGNIAVDGDFIGTVESEEQIYVVAKAAGDVTDTFFEVGDMVNAGDLMFTIDDSSAQISMKQASAALTTANASLSTAQAGVNSANAAVNATTAAVNESFGTVGTTEKQLQLAIDKANNDFAATERTIGNLEDTLDGIKDGIKSIEKAIDAQQDAKKRLEALIAAGPVDPQRAQYEADLAMVVASIKQLDNQKMELESSESSVKSNLATARDSKCLTVENADIARSQQSDYENYTRATIGNRGLSSIASAQAGVVQAQAGVTQSKAGITQAQAGVDAAQLMLDNTRVTAPVSGIVTSKNVTKNNMINTGSVAYTIMSDGAKYVTFYVSEVVMKEIMEGQTITVDRNGTIYEATVTENPGVADAANGLFKIKALINGGADIINGVKVKLTMVTQHTDNALTLPIDAVYHESEKSYVYTVVNGKANKVYVETGLFDADRIEIISGITEADYVISTWSSQLRNGVEVNVENSVSKNDSQTGVLVERN